ncbi:ABC transporter permease [Nocardia sp. CA2R105]|uniref:ABC transporter permease n=1 Tax=Nocardia coffeae TaxID=2873381 RepID=UPI001CA64F28|nr:ABC transporter permease [Nocardia coffeae]MBY8858822.1 ABC transporter permease [Nocardia coffeae]
MNSMRMSSVRAIELVAGREIGTRLRSRSFLVITIVLVAAVVGTVVLFGFLGRTQQSATPTVGVTAQTARYQQMLVGAGQTAGQRIRTVLVDRAAGESRVRSGDLTALFTGVSDGRLQVVVKSSLPDGLRTGFDLLARQIALNQQISALGGDPATVQRMISTATVDSRSLQPADDHRGELTGIASVVGVLTYIMLLISIQLTGQGVVEEKANRIVELLLATIRPWELLAGKVFGIGVVTIGQVVVLAAAGAGAASALGVLHISAAVLTSAVGWAVLWYLLGYFAYALVIAAAAALVSRQEDLASVATPVTVIVIAAYLVGQTVVPAHPDGVAAVVLSFVPLLSPVVMPMRAVYGVPGQQMAAAVVIALVTIVFTVWLAGRVYANAVLHTGGRVSLRTALARAMPARRVGADSVSPDQDAQRDLEVVEDRPETTAGIGR